MNRFFLFLLPAVLSACVRTVPAPAELALPVDKAGQARVLITTDLECDDMNGLILSLLYADHYDLAGIVWTAGMYHFNGDGGLHTLGQITPNFRCNAQHCEHRVQTAADLTEYRPVDPTWLPRILDCYEADYQYLSQNNPNYPIPDYLRSITKVGNIEFEGDYRFETEGSRFIMELILDDDPRPLIIQHWGGINTTVRALYSIYERYHGTPEWDAVLAKVVGKVRIGGSGEDNCRADSKIDAMFPGLQNGGYGLGGFFSYGSFFVASDMEGRRASDALQPYLHAPWNLEAYKYGHGKLTEQIWLMAEGRAIYGEPLIYNYGLIDYMDWGESARLGWGPASLVAYPRANYEPYSWAFCQFGCASFIDIGLRSDVSNRDERYSIIMWEELAARADWAICGPADCNHAPIVTAEQRDFRAAPGQTVELGAAVRDPDGDRLDVSWYVPAASCTYKKGQAEGLTVAASKGFAARFTVPSDAQAGDRLVVNLEVRDRAERPMTRFAQYVITVQI